MWYTTILQILKINYTHMVIWYCNIYIIITFKLEYGFLL